MVSKTARVNDSNLEKSKGVMVRKVLSISVLILKLSKGGYGEHKLNVNVLC